MIRRAGGAALFLCLVATGCSGDGNDAVTAFCDSMRAATAVTGAVSDLDLSDERVVEIAIADLQAVRADAPDEIRDEASSVADTWEAVLRALAAAAPGAYLDVLRDKQDQLDAVRPDADALNRYSETNCGLRFEGPAAPTPTATPLDLED